VTPSLSSSNTRHQRAALGVLRVAAEVCFQRAKHKKSERVVSV
jgi:hypothetical protein